MVIRFEELQILKDEKTVKKENVYFVQIDEEEKSKDLDASKLLPPAGNMILTKRHLCFLTKGRKKEDSWKKTIMKGVAKGLIPDFGMAEIGKLALGKINEKKKSEIEKTLNCEYSFLIPLERIQNYSFDKRSRFVRQSNFLFMSILNENGATSEYAMLGQRPDKPKGVDLAKWTKLIDKVMKDIPKKQTQYSQSTSNQNQLNVLPKQNSTNSPIGNINQPNDKIIESSSDDKQENKKSLESEKLNELGRLKLQQKKRQQ